jgi:hypothetical protein
MSGRKSGQAPGKSRRDVVRDLATGQHMAPRQTVTSKRKTASTMAERREGHRSKSPKVLSAQSRSARRKRQAGKG